MKSFKCECGNSMRAVIVEYLSVPEDHIVGRKVQLTCPVCKKCRVKNFYPDNQSEDEAFENLHLPTELNDRVSRAVLEICNLVWNYERYPTEININRVAEILTSLNAGDFLLLYAELDDLATNSFTLRSFKGERVKEREVLNTLVALVKTIEEKKKSS